MPTFTGKHTIIHYNQDLSGDILVHDTRTDSGAEFHGQDILDFAQEQWSRKITEALEEAIEHGQWVPDTSDAYHKEIMDLLKEIRDNTRPEYIAVTPANARCNCHLHRDGEITGGWICPLHGHQMQHKEQPMPCTSWKDIAGQLCLECGMPASHYYGGPLCCQCHQGNICSAYETLVAHILALTEDSDEQAALGLLRNVAQSAKDAMEAREQMEQVRSARQAIRPGDKNKE